MAASKTLLRGGLRASLGAYFVLWGRWMKTKMMKT